MSQRLRDPCDTLCDKNLLGNAIKKGENEAFITEKGSSLGCNTPQYKENLA